jgi:c-di-GMP-binding flagellar brake protein YcgR
METTERPPRFLVSEYKFEDMHLKVGDHLQIESASHTDKRHYTTLVGFVPAQSVLMRTPFEEGLPAPYVDGEAVTVRIFTGVGIFAFDSAVQRVCVSPFHYLHLNFPTTVRGTQIRTTERVKVYMPTQVVRADKAPVAGVITDVGIGGAALECSEHMSAGEHVTVHLRFSLEQMHLTADFDTHALLHRQHASPAENQAATVYRCGVEFEDLTLGQTVLLQNFVYHQLLENHQVVI